MTGEAHWLDFGIVFGGGFIVLALVLGLVVRDRLRRRRLRFNCPVIREDVECTAVQNMTTGCWQDVQSCSAFTPANNVSCQKGCLEHLNAGDVVAR